VRSARQLEQATGISVLATVPTYATARERIRDRARIGFAFFVVTGVLAAFAITYWFRLHNS